jgi:hypothetical protein
MVLDERAIKPGDCVPATFDERPEHCRAPVLCKPDYAPGSNWAQLEALRL